MLELNFPGILALVKYLTYFVIEEHEVVIALEEGSIDRAVTKFLERVARPIYHVLSVFHVTVTTVT